MTVIMLIPPASGKLVYLGASRADPDFTDDDLELCRTLQPCLVALYARLTSAEPGIPDAAAALTLRERVVLGLLADGLTADAIARRLSTRPAAISSRRSGM